MANNGRDQNGSRFLITFIVTAWLDGQHVVFGEVLSGHETIDKMNNLGTSSGVNLTSTVKIVDSGEIPM